MTSLVTKMLADVERAKKAAKKTKSELEEHVEQGVPHEKSTIDTMVRKAYDGYLNEKADAIELLCDMMEDPDNRYAQAMQRLATIVANKSQSLKQKQSYMITIRPDDNKVNLLDFIDHVNFLVNRRCFIEGHYSYEQKGTNPSDLGKGMHVHIVAKMTQTSKGQVLRDVTSSFKDWIEKGYITANNIDVRTTKNPDTLVNDYLVEYKSIDDHKEVTQPWDELWRTGNSLKRLYTITQ